MSKNEYRTLFIATFIFVLALIFLALRGSLDAPQVINLILSFVLVLVTVIYVKRTADIARATKLQAEASRVAAEASEKSVNEIREQRLSASKPSVLQKPIYSVIKTFGGSRDYFSHFDVYNAGNGPAIEIEMILMNKSKEQKECHRESFLRAGEVVQFVIGIDLSSLVGNTYYLVSQYKSINYEIEKLYYQTWLPFEFREATTEKGRYYAIAGELELHQVSENDRIQASSLGSKPV